MSKNEINRESSEVQRRLRLSRRYLLALAGGAALAALNNPRTVDSPASENGQVSAPTVETSDSVDKIDLPPEDVLRGLDYVNGLLNKIDPESTGVRNTAVEPAFAFMAYGMDNVDDPDSVVGVLDILGVAVKGEQFPDESWYLNLKMVGPTDVSDQGQPNLDCYVVGHQGGVIGLYVRFNDMPDSGARSNRDVYMLGADDAVAAFISAESEDAWEEVTVIENPNGREIRVSRAGNSQDSSMDYGVMVFASGENPLGNPGGLEAERVLPDEGSLIRSPGVFAEPVAPPSQTPPSLEGADIKQA